MVFKNRYKIGDLIALIDQKKERLVEIQEEEQLLQQELCLLTQELLARSTPVI